MTIFMGHANSPIQWTLANWLWIRWPDLLRFLAIRFKCCVTIRAVYVVGSCSEYRGWRSTGIFFLPIWQKTACFFPVFSTVLDSNDGNQIWFSFFHRFFSRFFSRFFRNAKILDLIRVINISTQKYCENSAILRKWYFFFFNKTVIRRRLKRERYNSPFIERTSGKAMAIIKTKEQLPERFKAETLEELRIKAINQKSTTEKSNIAPFGHSSSIAKPINWQKIVSKLSFEGIIHHVFWNQFRKFHPTSSDPKTFPFTLCITNTNIPFVKLPFEQCETDR